ncbi:MAG TPA: ABC transporter permease [Actinomycetes bacterium]|nr:ABC transporter permease [Actinomycetes bacterium]
MAVGATGVLARGRSVSDLRRRVTGMLYLALAAVMAWPFGFGVSPGTDARFLLNQSPAAHIPDAVVPVRPFSFVLAALCAYLGAHQLVRGFGRRAGLVLGAVLALFVLSFLAWAAKDASMNLVVLLGSTLLRSVPLTLGALSGVLCERSGVINVAIEGQFLIAAFAGAMVGSATTSLWTGLVAGVVAGGLVGALLAVLAIRYQVDQIVVGVVLNLFALGLTGFLTDRVLIPHQQTLNTPNVFSPVDIPLLSRIPLIGPVLFGQNVFIYLMYLLLVVVHVGLFHTRWGLRVRAVGEHPRAADTVGIRVLALRYRNVILGGMAAGLGGAYFTLGSVGSFAKNMTSGRGFIALAAMIFGHWSPFGAFAAALLFGFADALQSILAVLNVPIPSQFLLMAPYVATILAVAGLVGRVRPPAADGKPYTKE